jgi:hypothetical protein
MFNLLHVKTRAWSEVLITLIRVNNLSVMLNSFLNHLGPVAGYRRTYSGHDLLQGH